MPNYNFLTGVTLIDSKRRKMPPRKNPSGMTVRIFSDGSVYPSQELVDKYNLEYKNKDESPGFGFDIVDSKEWDVTAEFPRMILLGLVTRDNPKVDLFSYCRHNDDGSPKASVITQGSVSSILLDLVRSMGYLTDEQKYCDLIVREEHPITTSDNLYYIPKTIARGSRQGEKTYERRENMTLFPVDTGEETVGEVATEATAEITTSN